MNEPQYEPPESPDDWIEVCERELRNIRGAYLGELSNDAKIDHALKAAEAALKAIIWKHEKWDEWPPKSRKELSFLYRHNLDVLVDRCGLRTRLTLNAPVRASWQVLVNAVIKEHRYSHALPSDAEANSVAKCARHPDNGVVPWLLQYYREMN